MSAKFGALSGIRPLTCWLLGIAVVLTAVNVALWLSPDAFTRATGLPGCGSADGESIHTRSKELAALPEVVEVFLLGSGRLPQHDRYMYVGEETRHRHSC